MKAYFKFLADKEHLARIPRCNLNLKRKLPYAHSSRVSTTLFSDIIHNSPNHRQRHKRQQDCGCIVGIAGGFIRHRANRAAKARRRRRRKGRAYQNYQRCDSVPHTLNLSKPVHTVSAIFQLRSTKIAELHERFPPSNRLHRAYATSAKAL